jgi:beta-catenin-like protein 1
MQMLDRKTKSLKDIVRTLQVHRDNVDDDVRTSSADAEDDTERALSQRDILQHLIDFLDSC